MPARSDATAMRIGPRTTAAFVCVVVVAPGVVVSAHGTEPVRSFSRPAEIRPPEPPSRPVEPPRASEARPPEPHAIEPRPVEPTPAPLGTHGESGAPNVAMPTVAPTAAVTPGPFDRPLRRMRMAAVDGSRDRG